MNAWLFQIIFFTFHIVTVTDFYLIRQRWYLNWFPPHCDSLPVEDIAYQPHHSFLPASSECSFRIFPCMVYQVLKVIIEPFNFSFFSITGWGIDLDNCDIEWFFLWSCMDVRVGLWRRLSAEELMLLNCGVGEDSWESLGLQGDPTSPFWRRSALRNLWKEWC